ncbi:MAG: hypothetical protein K6B15_06410 [Parasporobacterium sp.]|nr:hypothetical protein [Parasporobacterium sp.]
MKKTIVAFQANGRTSPYSTAPPSWACFDDGRGADEKEDRLQREPRDAGDSLCVWDEVFASGMFLLLKVSGHSDGGKDGVNL